MRKGKPSIRPLSLLTLQSPPLPYQTPGNDPAADRDSHEPNRPRHNRITSPPPPPPRFTNSKHFRHPPVAKSMSCANHTIRHNEHATKNFPSSITGVGFSGIRKPLFLCKLHLASLAPKYILTDSITSQPQRSQHIQQRMPTPSTLRTRGNRNAFIPLRKFIRIIHMTDGKVGH